MTDIPHIPDLIREAFAARPAKVFRDADGKRVDRSKVLNASEIGRCLRELGFRKANPERAETDFLDLRTAGYAERGNNVEDWINRLLIEASAEDRGIWFELVGDTQVSFSDGRLSATPDGLMSWEPDNSGVVYLANIDIKSIDPRTNRANLPKHENVMQVMTACHLIRERYHSDVVKVVGSVILYVDASNYNDMTQHFVPYDPQFASVAYERHRRIFSSDPNDLPAEGVARDYCRTCAFTHECSAMTLQEQHDAVFAEAERVLNDLRNG